MKICIGAISRIYVCCDHFYALQAIELETNNAKIKRINIVLTIDI